MQPAILKNFDKKKVGFFRFAKLGGSYLITNELGDFHFLNADDFKKFVTGKLSSKNPLYKKLRETNFIKDKLDTGYVISRWRRRNQFLWGSPGLHIIVTTLRCDHKCVYCQANSKDPNNKKYDMTLKTAQKTVERIFECPNPNVTIEFQGGEPLLNFPVVKEVVKNAQKLAKKTLKNVTFTLVTNLTPMTKEKLKFLTDNKVNICTSLDGPRNIHNLNRVYTKGDSYANVLKWCKNAKKFGKPHHIDGLVTVTKAALDFPKKIVDEYFNMGMQGLFLRPVTPLGMAKGVWGKIGYAPEKFLKFYEIALDYILEINKKSHFTEMTAVVFLTKILDDIDFNFMDLRSPCGAGIGQIAYHYDGDVYTCDEARMVSEMGDMSFCIGNVHKDKYGDFINHSVTKCLVTSSCTDVQTTCSWCVYKPYCGVCPICNYMSENDLYGHMPENSWCKLHKGILDIIFTKLSDPMCYDIFRRWIDKINADKMNYHQSCFK